MGYELQAEGPWGNVVLAEYNSVRDALQGMSNEPELLYCVEKERIILLEVKTGRFEVLVDKNYKKKQESINWLKEGF